MPEFKKLILIGRPASGKSEFIDFLNQIFNEHGQSAVNRRRIISREKDAMPSPTDPDHDKKIRAYLAATLPVKNDKLKLVLDKKLPDTDIEGRLVNEWSRRAVGFERLLSDSGQKNPEENARRPASRKNARGVNQKIEIRRSEHRLSRLLIFGFIALFFSFVSAGFAPELARNTTDKLDKLIVYPVIFIAKKTSPDSREFYTEAKVSRPAITKGILAAYIIKNQPQAAGTGPRTIRVTEEDLRGRVAGISEESAPTGRQSEKSDNSGWRKILIGLTERLASLLPAKKDF